VSNITAWGAIMRERRKAERFPAQINIKIESLYKQDYVMIENVNQDILVTDVSKSGVGFITNTELLMDYYFNARIAFDEEHFFYSVLKIIRIEQKEDGIHYGCEFVGLADILAKTVDDYREEKSHE
jgi:hypothetical protein